MDAWSRCRTQDGWLGIISLLSKPPPNTRRLARFYRFHARSSPRRTGITDFGGGLVKYMRGHSGARFCASQESIPQISSAQFPRQWLDSGLAAGAAPRNAPLGRRYFQPIPTNLTAARRGGHPRPAYVTSANKDETLACRRLGEHGCVSSVILIGSGERLILPSRNYAPFLRLLHTARPNRKRNATAHRVDIS